MRSQGSVSRVICSTRSPIRRVLPTCAGVNSRPLTSRLARRVIHGNASPSSAQALAQLSLLSTVTWRRPGLPRKSPSTPRSGVTRARSQATIGALERARTAIPQSSIICRQLPAASHRCRAAIKAQSRTFYQVSRFRCGHHVPDCQRRLFPTGPLATTSALRLSRCCRAPDRRKPPVVLSDLVTAAALS